MLRNRILITGNPGIGKTTCLLKVIRSLKLEGVSVDGFYSREVRIKGGRVGFKIFSILSGEWGWLAKANNSYQGPRIGRYKVIEEDLKNFGVASLRRAAISAEVVAVDEIGPMELISEQFNEMVEYILTLDKIFLATVHKKFLESLKSKALRNGQVVTFSLSLDNRNVVSNNILGLIKKVLISRP